MTTEQALVEELARVTEERDIALKRLKFLEPELTPREQAAWYEAGLSAHGVEMDDYLEASIKRYGALLCRFWMEHAHTLTTEIEKLKNEARSTENN